MTQSPSPSKEKEIEPKSAPESERATDKEQSPEQSPQPKPPHKHRLPFILGGLAVAIAVGVGVWYFVLRPEPEGPLELSGRIEGYETDIGAKVPGKIEQVTVREGDTVRVGQLVVQLDDNEIQARLREAQARVETAQQQKQQAQLQLDVLENRIREAQLNLQQVQQDAEGRVSEARARLAAAEAQLQQAQARQQEIQAELALARTDRDRFAQLLQGGAIAQQQYDRVQTRVETLQASLQSQQAVIEAARRQVNAAQGQLAQAQTSRFNPDITQAQIDTLRKQQDQARAQLEATQSEINQAQAAQDAIAAQVDDLSILSPIQGTVLTRAVEPGEVIAAGQPLLTAIDLNNVYLRGYIPEGDIGKVRVGQPAQVYLDSFPDRPFDARVTQIDSQASFTPENIYFPEDRVQQVFGLKLSIENPEGFAKPGMPADAEIFVEE